LGKKRGSWAAGQRGSDSLRKSLPTDLPLRPTAPLTRLVDLSHTIEHGMTTYPGLPGPIVCDYLSRETSRGHYAPGVEFQIGKIEMVANTGTYLDSPFHRYADRKDLSQLPLERVANLDAVVIRVPAGVGRAISPAVFQGIPLTGKAVLVHTGWDAHWRTDRYLTGHPFLTGLAARFLLDQGASLVGIDSLNIDDTGDLARPVHSTLLAADIPIVEHLCNLGSLPDRGFRFFAVPAKVAAFGSWPVRAFGHVLSSD
jgi:arylformamidase